jgi:predicted transposase YbfD/YdcC
VEAVLARLGSLPDARGARGKRYPLAPLLLLILLAKLAGEDRPSGIADWLAHRASVLHDTLGLAWQRMPHHNTIRRVLAAAVLPEELDTLIGAVLCEQAAGQLRQISIDGKTVRGTIATPTDRGDHLLAAYAPATGAVLGQVVAGGKDNEISTAPQLLAAVPLAGAVVTADALHTQRRLSAQIVAAGGAYVWLAKENQPTLHREIAELFESDDRTVAGGRVIGDRRRVVTVNVGHGRQERRTLMASTDLAAYSDWPHLAQVFRLERERCIRVTGKRERETVYGLSSLPRERAGAATLLALVRAHWGIENGLHHRRDVTFHEDATRLTQGHAGRVMASLNNLLIGVLRRAGFTNLAAARRRCAADLHLSITLLAAVA